MIKGYGDLVYTLISLPNGQIIALVSNDKIVRLWDATTGILRQILEGYNCLIATIDFLPDS